MHPQRNTPTERFISLLAKLAHYRLLPFVVANFITDLVRAWQIARELNGRGRR